MAEHSRIIEVLTDNPDGLSVSQIAQETDLNQQDVVYILTGSKSADFIPNVRGIYKLNK